MKEDVEEEQPWGRGKSRLRVIRLEYPILDGSGTTGLGDCCLFADVPPVVALCSIRVTADISSQS